MKLFLLPALLLGLAPVAAETGVRFEADGVRVGAELVTGSSLSLKDAGALPVLVSGGAVENLSASALAVGVAGQQVTLDAGLRLSRTSDGWRIAGHGVAFAVEAGGRTLLAEGAADFKATGTAFDFGPAGTLEGASLLAKVTSVPQDPKKISPERSQTRRPTRRVRTFRSGDPLASGVGADSYVVRLLVPISPGF